VLGPRPLRPFLRTDKLAAETFSKSLGMLSFGEAEDIHVCIVAAEEMTARAE
jgi:hypothetical protein